MSLPKFTESMIRSGAVPQTFQRGKSLYEDDAVSNASVQGNTLVGDCEGTSALYYRVRVTLDEAGIRDADCTCPYEFGGYCKHVVALLLAYLHHPKRFVVRQDPADLLADLGHDDLLALTTKLLREKPDLYEWVEASISVPGSTGKTAKKRKKKVDAEVYRRQIIGILHSLDGMRASEAYWHVGSLVKELEGVPATALKFLEAGDADTALAILLTLLEETCHGIEFIDDSNGELGGFVGELGQPLAEVILSMNLSAVAREKLVSRLTQLERYASDYGMEGNLYLAIQAAQYGWEGPPKDAAAKHPMAGESEFDDEWIEEAIEDYGWSEEEVYEGHAWSLPSLLAQDLTEAKLNVLERQGRIDEYLALCQKAKRHLRYALKLCDLDRVSEAMKYAKKHLATADEARQLAEKLRTLKHIAEALQIGERGLKLKGPKAELGEWLGPVEEAQGRKKEALRAWLAAFREEPSLEAYKTIKRLAESGWKKLRPEVMAALRKSQDEQVLAEVHLLEQEWDEAIKVAEGRDVWYTVVEMVADQVLPHRPEWVARVSLKHAERLMVEVKSKNYPIAAEWLKRAKKAHIQLGQTDKWRAYLKRITEKYKRRPALQAQLRRL